MRQYVLQGLLSLSLGGDAHEVGTAGGPVLSTVRAMRGAVGALRAGGRVLRLYLQLLQVLAHPLHGLVRGHGEHRDARAVREVAESEELHRGPAVLLQEPRALWSSALSISCGIDMTG